MRFKRTIVSLLIFMLMSVIHVSTAQPPPTPSEQGQDGNQPAPIGSGIAILLAMAGAYGAKKVYDARKKIRE